MSISPSSRKLGERGTHVSFNPVLITLTATGGTEDLVSAERPHPASNPLVTVFPSRYVLGVEPGRPLPEPVGITMPLATAFQTRWPTDAHFATYIIARNNSVRPRIPRVNLAGLPFLRERGYEVFTTCVPLDVDQHGDVTEEERAEAWWRQLRAPSLRNAFHYTTRGGARAVCSIYPWVPLDWARAGIEHLHALVRADGLEPDPACIDANRLYRLPLVVRDGVRQQSVLVGLGELQPIALDFRSTRTRAARRNGSVPVTFSRTLPTGWDVSAIAAAVRQEKRVWHTLALVLSGAFLQLRVPAERVPALILAIFSATGCDTRLEDRVAAAQSTTRRFAGGSYVMGWRELLRDYCTIAGPVDAFCAEVRRG